MQDDDLERKSGIYPYVLDGDERRLNIRAFSDKTKREAYDGILCKFPPSYAVKLGAAKNEKASEKSEAFLLIQYC